MYINFNTLGIPDVSKIHIHARAPFKEISETLKAKNITKLENTKAGPNDMFYFTEILHVTEEMRARYDIVKLFKSFTLGESKDKQD